jgi:hypothetical protein
MMRHTLQRSLTGLLLLGCLTVGAQEKGSWRAASTTAKSITGDLMLTDEKIIINGFSVYPMARIRTLEKPEASALFDPEGTATAPGVGSLYRLVVPGDKKFLHKNSLCGNEDTQWMATYVSGHTLQVALFSGEKPPVLTAEAMASTTDLCGTFTYVK